MGDKTIYKNGQPLSISEGLQNFIDAMVEEIVLEGKPFDTQKKYLKKFSENEGLDYETLESKLSDFIEVMQEWQDLHTKSSELMAKMLAKDCYLSESELGRLFSTTNKPIMQMGNHDYVDLGLPSGTLWATCNVGASKPEDYGSYFAWGETSTKSIYDWDGSTYKYANGDYKKLTKYCNRSDYGNNGFTDNLTALQAGDDPATVNWGSGWRTPSKEQWEELLSNTTHQWTTQNGVKGRKFTSKKNGQTLFLPAAGNRCNSELMYAGSYGSFWSRSLDTDIPDYAWFLYFDSGGCDKGYGGIRNYGFSVRPVREK